MQVRCFFLTAENGYTSGCYDVFLDALAEKKIIFSVDKLGHNPDYPVKNNWDHLTEKVADSIKKQCSEPLIAVGHSLGGTLNALAALKYPELFKALILVEAPLFLAGKCRFVGS